MPETKEKNNESSHINIDREIRIVDVDKRSIDQVPVPREIKTWMEKVEQASAQSQQIDDDTGQALLTATNPVNPKITLPTTRSKFISGFKKTFDDAGHWFSVFLLRFIKIKKGDVTFKPDDTHQSI